MQNLARNTFPVWYKTYLGSVEVIDEYGNRTGTREDRYSDLSCESLSVSANKGTSEAEMFGSFKDYDRTMSTANTCCPIEEDSILWLDGQDTAGPHNYIVKKRAVWKNSISFAIKKVDVNYG